MTRKFPLQTLLDLSNLRQDEAAKQLGKLLASETAAAEKLQLLTSYRDEYQGRFANAAQTGLRPDEWSNYRAFLDRLESAIEEARALLLQTQRNTHSGRKEWLAKRDRVKAMDTLALRHTERLLQVDLKNEQKASDEFSARERYRERDDD